MSFIRFSLIIVGTPIRKKPQFDFDQQTDPNQGFIQVNIKQLFDFLYSDFFLTPLIKVTIDATVFVP